MLEPETDFV